jgi:hypothetical protein
MTSAQRAVRNALWSAAGGFAFGWVAKGLVTPLPPAVEAQSPLIAVAPQNAPVKATEGGMVMEDGRLVTPNRASDPAALVIGPSDPCAAVAPRRKK